MSRIKFRNLFDQAKRLKRITQRLEIRWLRNYRAYMQRRKAIEKKSADRTKDLDTTITKLKKAGFSLSEIYERIRKKH